VNPRPEDFWLGALIGGTLVAIWVSDWYVGWAVMVGVFIGVAFLMGETRLGARWGVDANVRLAALAGALIAIAVLIVRA
jgi:hypothetical protein